MPLERDENCKLFEEMERKESSKDANPNPSAYIVLLLPLLYASSLLGKFQPHSSHQRSRVSLAPQPFLFIFSSFPLEFEYQNVKMAESSKKMSKLSEMKWK